MRRVCIVLLAVCWLMHGAAALGQDRPPQRSDAPRPAGKSVPPAQKADRPAAGADARVDAFLKKLGKGRTDRLSRKDVEGTELGVIFDRIDVNRDGYLDRDELLRAVDYLPAVELRTQPGASRPADPTPKGPSINKEEMLVLKQKIKAFLQQYDTNEDGKIDRKEFRALFTRIDRNKDGAIDKEELREAALALSKAPGGPPSPRREREEVHPEKGQSAAKRVDALLQELDANHDGRISRDEAKGTKLAFVFDRLDRNKDGFLDRTELLQSADVLPPVEKERDPGKATELDLRIFHFMKHFDTNKDGKLDWDEAQALFIRLDTNKDGSLDENELIHGAILAWPSGAKEIEPAEPPRSEVVPRERKVSVDRFVDAFLRGCDADRDGRLSREELRVLFDQLDTNRDGYLDREELRRAALMLLEAADKLPAEGAVGPGAAGGADLDARVRFLIAQFDKDRDGKISRKEAQGTPLAEAFDELDLNKDGFLDRAELLKAAKRLPPAGKPAPRNPR
jgi:Ca2+-binding EF-hand superfamily protein